MVYWKIRTWQSLISWLPALVTDEQGIGIATVIIEPSLDLAFNGKQSAFLRRGQMLWAQAPGGIGSNWWPKRGSSVRETLCCDYSTPWFGYTGLCRSSTERIAFRLNSVMPSVRRVTVNQVGLRARCCEHRVNFSSPPRGISVRCRKSKRNRSADFPESEPLSEKRGPMESSSNP
jgi:hypothetical protein